MSMNLETASVETLSEMANLISQYKDIRPIVQYGDQYRLLSPRVGDTSAVQYVSSDKRESVLFVSVHLQRFQALPPILYLRGLQPDALYSVTEQPEPISGQALMLRGLDVYLRGDLRSKLIRIRQIGE